MVDGSSSPMNNRSRHHDITYLCVSKNLDFIPPPFLLSIFRFMAT